MEVVKGPDSVREEKLIHLMTAYEKDLLRMCCVYLRDTELAKDATQETFLKAYKALHTFRGDAGEKTWLMRIAINTCKDIRRSAWHRFVDRKVTLDTLPEPIAPCAENNREITEEVMRLPRKLMEVVLLYYYQGMTLSDIGESLGISPPAVSKRLKQARSRLHAALEGGIMDE